MIADRDLMEEVLTDFGALYLEPRAVFDAAIIGMAERAGGLCVVAYDSDACIAALMDADGMDFDEAVEFFEFNTKGAYLGDGTPIFIDRLAPP